MWIKITKAFASFKIGDIVEVVDKFGKVVISKGWAEKSDKPKRESSKKAFKAEPEEVKEPKL